MDRLHVLIVEDEPLLSMELEEIVEETVPAVVVVKSSVTETKNVLSKPFDLALLDVDVTNGKTFEIAQQLSRNRIPYVFVSASDKNDLPDDLQNAPFIRKPFAPAQIKKVVLGADQRRRDHSGE